MGREVRMIKAGWQHPKDAKGHYEPLLAGPFSKYLSEWDEEAAHWAKGEVLDYSTWPEMRTFKPKDADVSGTYKEWSGKRPIKDEYMPEWPEGEATMLVMYENTSEGTPLSPPFATPEELARWLADNGASAFGGMTATYEQWLPTCKSGWAPSAIISNGRMASGVEAMAKS